MPKFIFARGLQKGGEVACADPGIFVRGVGGPGQSDIKSSDVFFVVFLGLSLFYRSQMVNFKESIIFQGSRGGKHLPGGGSNFFQGGPIAYSL